MYPDQKMDKLIERLKRKIEAAIIVFCIIIIVACCVYGYILRPMKDKSVNLVAYEKFQRFSMPLGDTTGTEDYDEQTVSERTDDWGIHYVDKERVK
jgi:hypothetical protein